MVYTYVCKKEKIFQFLNNDIIPQVNANYDIDYDKLIDLIAFKVCVSKKQAKECLDLCISQGLIKKENNIITCSDAALNVWIAHEKQKHDEIKAVLG